MANVYCFHFVGKCSLIAVIHFLDTRRYDVSDATPLQVLGHASPEAAKAFGQLRRAAATEGGLDHVTEHLVSVASLAARGQLASMAVHARRAVRDGVPVEQLRQSVVATLGAAAVFGEVVAALRVLDQIDDDASGTQTPSAAAGDAFGSPGAPASQLSEPLAATLYAPEHPEAVVLLHSLATDRHVWAPLVDPLAASVAVLAVDLPGHGGSPAATEPSVEAVADQVAATIDAAGLRRVAVIGMSLGGSVAQAVAVRHPELVRALGLVDTTAWYGPHALETWADRVAQVQARGMVGLAGFQLDRWFSDDFRAHRPDLCDATLALFTATNVQGYADACTALGAMDLRQGIENITCPTVVVVGEHDYATPVAHAEDIQRRIVGASMHVLAGCKHLSAVERPAAVLAHVAATIGA